jgi:predicted Rossmann fold nucleotide-binding protein DprA/Smf involved in DNA uptake
MAPGEGYDLGALARLSGLGPAALLSRLTDLELAGRVRRAGGGRFMRPR